MKILKASLLSLFFVSVALFVSSFSVKSDAPVAKKFVTDQYVWTNATLFQVGVTTPSTIINTASNWAAGTGTTTGSTYLSQIDAVYSSGSITKQQVLNEVKKEYDRLGSLVPPQTFTNGYSFVATISGISVTITIYLQ